MDGEELEPFFINGFFNGYMVDKVGEYNIDLIYGAQRFATLGFRVSGISWLFSGVLLGLLVVRSRWRKRE